MLPEIRSSSEVYGRAQGVLDGIPVAGDLGDQQAALFGQGCHFPGRGKNTYGTGSFVLQNTGDEPPPLAHGLLSTLAWTIAPEVVVLGGGLEAAADLLLPRVTDAMRALGTPAIELRATSLGADAALLGAVKLVLDRMDAEFFGPTVSR